MRGHCDERPAKWGHPRREGGAEAAIREHHDELAPNLEDARRQPDRQTASRARAHHLQLIAAGRALRYALDRAEAKRAPELGERPVPVVDRLLRIGDAR